MDEIHGIVESKLEKVTVKLGYMGKSAQLFSATFAMQKPRSPGKEQAQKARYLMLRERSPPLGRVPQNDLITFQLPHSDLSGQPVRIRQAVLPNCSASYCTAETDGVMLASMELSYRLATRRSNGYAASTGDLKATSSSPQMQSAFCSSAASSASSVCPVFHAV